MHRYQPYSPTVVQGLHWITLVATLGFGLFHLLSGQAPLVGIIELAACPFLLYSLRRTVRRGSLSRKALLVATVLMMVSIGLFTYTEGFRGLAFVCPLVAGLFYLLPVNLAGAVGGLFTLVMFLLAAASIDGELLLRFGVSVSITYCFIWFLVQGQKESLGRLRRAYLTDPLTGLANRHAMEKWLDNFQSSPHSLCLFQLNIHQFKAVNQRYGRAVGDALLKQVAERLRQVPGVLSAQGMLAPGERLQARTSGDEFVLGLPLNQPRANAKVAEAIHRHMAGAYRVADHQLMLSLTLGYSRDEDVSPSDKQQQANLATVQGKSTQPGLSYEFSEALAMEMRREAVILQGLKQAMAENAFELVYMPIHGLAAPWCSSAEVLIRCTHPELAGIGPERFIPIAEKYGLIYELDLWVIRRCFAQLQAMDADDHLRAPDLRLALNISSMQLNNPRLPAQLLTLAAQYQFDLNRLDLELTETALVSHTSEGMKMLTELRRHGIKVVLDDFGTGYTAFTQLQHYPIDRLKIDRSFVSQLQLEGAEQTRSLVDVILRVAAIYEIPVTAEGVETRKQEEYLIKRGCHHFQGYLYSAPQPLELLLKQRKAMMADTLATGEVVRHLEAQQSQVG